MKRSSDTFIFTAEIGTRLRDLRLKAGLTQLELARAMGRAGKKAGNLVGRIERGDERYPSLGVIADFLRGCRAGFKDIVVMLDVYTSLPAANERVFDAVLARVAEEVPEMWKSQVTSYDRQLDRSTSTAKPVAGKVMPDRLKRLEWAKKTAAAARRRFLYGQYLKEAVDETGLVPVMTVTVPMFDHGLEWFRILYRTRKARTGVREKLLAESEAKFEHDSRFPQDAIRKLEDGVRRQFALMEMAGDLDWLPSLTLDEYEARLLAPSRKRSLRQKQHDEHVRKFNQYDLARQAAFEQVSEELQPMLDEAGVAKERRPVYNGMVGTCCTAALNFEPGSVSERRELDMYILEPHWLERGLDTALARKLANVMLTRFRELARSFPPDPRPKR
jgi:transcriptional regulator with XRE-family HTH domain